MDFKNIFSSNGRIIIEPFKTDSIQEGNNNLKISFYRVSTLYTYSIQAQFQNRIFCKYPHPQDGLFDNIYECKQDAKLELKKFCDQNKLKKSYNRLVIPTITQLDLFDEL